MHGLFLLAVLFLQQPPAAPPVGIISGHLVESDRTPLARIFLVARPVSSQGEERQQARFAITDMAGAFRFENVEPGSYTIAMGSSYYYPGVTNRDTAAAVIVTSAIPEIRGLDFVVPSVPGVRLGGRVIFPDGKAPAGQQVHLSGGRVFRSLTAELAADGAFEFSRVTPGAYSLQVFPAMEPIDITVVDRDVTGIEIRLPRITNIQGTVAFEGRATRTNLGVSFKGPMPQHLSAAEVQPNGTFAIGLLDGEYRALVKGLPAGYYLKSFSAGSVNLLTQPLKVDGAFPSARVTATLALSAGVKIIGRVKGTSDTAPSAVSRRITLTGTAVDTLASGQVNEDGSFELSKVMPGTYAARVSLNASVSSAPVIVVVPDKDTKDFDISVPALTEVFGRVAVDGNGPAPRFSLMLIRGTGLNLKAAGEDTLPSIDPSRLDNLAKSGAAQIMEVEVDPLPEGTFKMMLPEGEYRVAAVEERGYLEASIPKPFFIRSLNYGPARLFTEPMIVSASEPAELHVGFGVALSNPWVKVSGRVFGLDASTSSARVALDSQTLAKLETPVNPDGTFEFPMVLVDEEHYSVSLVPPNDAASVARFSTVKDDVKNLEIIVPREREVTIRASVDGGGTVPGFLLNLSTTPCKEFCASEMTVVVKPERDGTFRAKLPEDERKVALSEDNLPLGYSVQSLTYGTIDLIKSSLKIAGSDTRDLEVKLAIDANVPSGSVRGRVTGLDPDSRNVQLVLAGVSFVSSFEAPVNADGSFVFSKLPQGTYALTLTGDAAFGRPTPSAIVVSGKDLTGIQIAVPRRTARPDRPSADERPAGTRITELGTATNQTSSESAAVANLRTINTAQVTYLSASNGNYGTLQNLIDAGLLDEGFLGVKAGYSFGVVASGPGYAATAIPADGGRYGFYSVPDAVVRYALPDTLTPPRQGGQPVR